MIKKLIKNSKKNNTTKDQDKKKSSSLKNISKTLTAEGWKRGKKQKLF